MSGYKKVFTIKYRGLLSKRKNSISEKPKSDRKASSVISLPNIDGLQKELSQKIA